MSVSPVEVEKYLKGIDYPAKKQDLMKYAQQNGAPQEILNVVKQLPEETFNRPTDVAKAVGEVDRKGTHRILPSASGRRSLLTRGGFLSNAMSLLPEWRQAHGFFVGDGLPRGEVLRGGGRIQREDQVRVALTLVVRRDEAKRVKSKGVLRGTRGHCMVPRSGAGQWKMASCTTLTTSITTAMKR